MPDVSPIRVEDCRKRVRVRFGDEYVADSVRIKLVWERDGYPTYYFPADDVRADLLVATGSRQRSPSRTTAAAHTVKVGDAEAIGAALWHGPDAPEGLCDHVRFEWAAMDAWFEEDEEVFVHPRNPYTRVDILQSTRNVRVEVDGVTVAESDQPRLLFETGLPTRHYLPKTAVRMELLEASDHHTDCPYKGTASYYDVVTDDATHENLAWWYPTTTSESAMIAGYLCFYDERVDVYVDGVLQERPRTPFGRPRR
jgi:uncharacterized protein (DUF427 family)